MRLILARPLHRAFYFVCAVLVLGLIFSTGGAGASGASNPSANPEQMLADIVQDMSSNHLKQAQAKADALVTAYPGFRLGHLIRGDLLLMRTRPVAQLGAAANGAHDSLKDLRDEAGVRLLATRMPQGDDRLPLAILTLRKDQKHALLVDARHSRIYLYAHRDGQLTLLRDFYMSQGKYGLNKAREGDSRTPQGVYRIIRRLPGAKLPDFYGEGALPLNYPNEWDKINGRSGSGIWIHGTPSDLYSRPPKATDGCVVLSNEDLRVLTTLIEVGTTPVVIGQNVQFVSRVIWERERAAASAQQEHWRRDMESGDGARALSHYSSRFTSTKGERAALWLAKRRFMSGAKHRTVSLGDVSQLRYSDRGDVIVSTFVLETAVGRFRHSEQKQQYWVREGSSWKIVAESNS